MTRRLLVGGVLTLLTAAAMAISPTVALADGPTQITITGDDLDEPLEVLAADDPERFTALYREVDWLIGRPSQSAKPAEEETLGPRIRLVVHIDGAARHRFNLYPLAEGGPRAHRPAKQPGDREVRAGWFYGRLSMPHTLASAGVPLSGGELDGGVGGGDPVPSEQPTAPGLAAMLDEWREGLRLTAVIMVTIMLGLAGVALLIRRKV